MWNKIVNPKTGRKVNVNSNIGKKILKNYIKQLGGGKLKNNPQTKRKLSIFNKMDKRFYTNYTNIKHIGYRHMGGATSTSEIYAFKTISDHVSEYYITTRRNNTKRCKESDMGTDTKITERPTIHIFSKLDKSELFENITKSMRIRLVQKGKDYTLSRLPNLKKITFDNCYTVTIKDKTPQDVVDEIQLAINAGFNKSHLGIQWMDKQQEWWLHYSKGSVYV